MNKAATIKPDPESDSKMARAAWVERAAAVATQRAQERPIQVAAADILTVT